MKHRIPKSSIVRNFQGALERLVRRFSLVLFILMGGPGTGVTSPTWEALGTRRPSWGGDDHVPVEARSGYEQG